MHKTAQQLIREAYEAANGLPPASAALLKELASRLISRWRPPARLATNGPPQSIPLPLPALTANALKGLMSRSGLNGYMPKTKA